MALKADTDLVTATGLRPLKLPSRCIVLVLEDDDPLRANLCVMLRQALVVRPIAICAKTLTCTVSTGPDAPSSIFAQRDQNAFN